MDDIDIVGVIIGMGCFILAGSIHEFSHAFANYMLGDNTAKNMGRLTINPVKHIDLFGTIIMPLFIAVTGFPVFGWMKAVPFNPNNFKNYSKGAAISAFAGPLSNMVQAGFALIIIRIATLIGGGMPGIIFQILYQYYYINILLMAFNLLPCPPLDGGWILHHFLPNDAKPYFEKYKQYGRFVLLGLLWTGLLQILLGPVYSGAGLLLSLVLRNNILFSFIPFLLAVGIVFFLLKSEIFRLYKKNKKELEIKSLRAKKNTENKVKGKLIEAGLSLEGKGIKLLEKIDNSIEIDMDDIQTIKLLKEKSEDNINNICALADFKSGDDYCRHCDEFSKCLYLSLKEKSGQSGL